MKLPPDFEIKIFKKNFSIYFSGALLGKVIGLFNLLFLGNLLEPSFYAAYVVFFLICDILGVLQFLVLPQV